jgi:putative acetyltransferase
LTTSLMLRPAEEADRDVLEVIRRDAILALAISAMSDRRAQDWADSADEQRVLRAIHEHEVWVAQKANCTVGWVEVVKDRVEGLYVRPKLAKEGIGSALMRHAEECIRSAGFRVAALDASPNAEPFYLHRGYEPRAARSEDTGLPMHKRLDAPGL